jgi:hypothetical protein
MDQTTDTAIYSNEPICSDSDRESTKSEDDVAPPAKKQSMFIWNEDFEVS